jgi:hypothetical protein
MIKFECSCGKKFNTRDENEGRRVICSGCKQQFIVPSPSSEIARVLPAADDGKAQWKSVVVQEPLREPPKPKPAQKPSCQKPTKRQKTSMLRSIWDDLADAVRDMLDNLKSVPVEERSPAPRQPTPVPARKLIVSSGDIQQPYNVLGMVQATADQEQSFFGSVSGQEAHKEVLQRLEAKACAMGADALIWVRVEGGKIVKAKFLAPINAYEAHASGTAVRFR